MKKCKACGAPILWLRTTSGKSMPCDPQPVMYWLTPRAKGKAVTLSGEVVSCVFVGDPDTADGTGFVPHWATCPKADLFREVPR